MCCLCGVLVFNRTAHCMTHFGQGRQLEQQWRQQQRHSSSNSQGSMLKVLSGGFWVFNRTVTLHDSSAKGGSRSAAAAAAPAAVAAATAATGAVAVTAAAATVAAL